MEMTKQSPRTPPRWGTKHPRKPPWKQQNKTPGAVAETIATDQSPMHTTTCLGSRSNYNTLNARKRVDVPYATWTGGCQSPETKKQRRIAASSSLKGFVIDSDTLDGQSSTPKLPPSPWRAKRAASIKNKTDESALTFCLGQQLEQLDWKQQILCPQCGDPLVGDAIDATTVDIETREQNVIRLFHTACKRRDKGKCLFICLGCGKHAVHSAKRLISNYCKCMQEGATHHSTSSLKENDDPKGSSSVVEGLLCCEENNWPLASQKFL